MNCSPADADVIHYTVDKFRNVVCSDLVLCLIVLKTNAMQSALCSTLLIYLKATAALICLVKFLCREDILVCSLRTERNGPSQRSNWKSFCASFFPQHILYERQLLIFNACMWFLMFLAVHNAQPHLTRCHAVLKLSMASEVRRSG